MKRTITGLLRGLIAVVAVSGAALIVSEIGHAQEYPNRSITIVVPYEAGGGVDRVARMAAEQLQGVLKSPVIVENRSGANGNVGAEYVARAAPDGYTLLYSPPGPLVINKLFYAKLSYDSDAFVPISLVVTSPNVLLVHPSVPAKTVEELVAYAKANPDRLNYASPGYGGTPHLTAEMFKMETGVSIVHVPFKGTSSLITSLIGGNVDLTFSELGNIVEYVRANKLRALGVASEKRNPSLPDVPTMAETLPGFYSASWSALVAPPNTPPAVVQLIYAALAQSFVKSEAVKKMMAASQFEAMVSTPQGLVQQIASERERWGKVIRATNIKQQ